MSNCLIINEVGKSPIFLRGHGLSASGARQCFPFSAAPPAIADGAFHTPGRESPVKRVVVAADSLETRYDTARYCVENKQAYCLFILKDNQATRRQDSACLFNFDRTAHNVYLHPFANQLMVFPSSFAFYAIAMSPSGGRPLQIQS